ncbi:hypothetical protein ALC62_04481, partial [Cyphomyrmex costatus]
TYQFILQDASPKSGQTSIDVLVVVRTKFPVNVHVLGVASQQPDLNPLDYYVWSVVERITYKSRHPNVTLLRTTIETAFIGMDSAIL